MNNDWNNAQRVSDPCSELRAEVERLRAERDDLCRQLAEAQEPCPCSLSQIAQERDVLSEQLDQAEADNAALVEMTKVRQEALCRVRAMNWNLGGPANRDANGAWVVHPDWEQKMLGIIADAIGPLNGDAPLGDHPGAGLLEEVAALRKVASSTIALLEGLNAHWIEAPTHQLRDVTTMLGVRLTELDAIRNRKDDR